MWKMVSYEACGRGHLKENIPCQDKTLQRRERDIALIALADGAGSCSKSDLGADIVTKYGAEIVKDNFDEFIKEENGMKVKKKIIDLLLKELENKSVELKCSIKDLSSTFLLVCVRGEEFFIGHLGDGVIGVLKEEKLKVISNPVNGEFINNTVFVTSSLAYKYMQIYRGNISDIDGFVLLSDGTCESLYDKRKKKLSIGIKKIMDYLGILDEEKIKMNLIKSFENLILKKTLDDCSIGIMIKKSYGEKVYKNLEAEEKLKIFNLKGNNGKFKAKKLYEYEKLLQLLSEKPLSRKEIYKKISLKNRYLRKEIRALENNGLVTSFNDEYYSNIKL
ncbi:PP2C family serine/threonine-protein phosphatase [uncultured Clostridium sp.]|uniref:PP2C family serine/threonine-protein phosphatase n=1 Tax=uncultured Clostridium sp. TaxID=59620 RepID=UPI00261E8548|nr:PP2C family serine/threonine-protein phosphatase [uncultured Clostridium sp.]